MKDIYLALDFPTWKEAKNFIDQHDLKGVPVKVGMELFYREGLDLVKRLKEEQHKVFLDLKLHDIPTTVYRAMKNLAKLDVDIVNVHALGGAEMMLRAKEGLIEGKSNDYPTDIIAITILTSHDQKTLRKDLRLQAQIDDYARHLAHVSKQSGMDGVVCSVYETKAIKALCGHDFITVTPGIRLKTASNDDQKRIATPLRAKKQGADRIVVGRSVTKAKDPRHAYEQVLKEWNDAE